MIILVIYNYVAFKNNLNFENFFKNGYSYSSTQSL